MPLRGDRRGLSRASRGFAVVAALAVVLGQFFALAHEIAVRHVRCAEHGELTHVAITIGAPGAQPSDLNAVRAEEVEAVAGHDHCATALTLQTGLTAQVVRSVVAATPPPASTPPETAAPPRERAFLLASAPKTSPPSG